MMVAVKYYKWKWLYYYCLLYEEDAMKEKMFIHWDAEGDFLEIRFGRPTPSYYKDLGNDVFERIDERTGKVSGYAFFNVQKKMAKEPKDIAVYLPVSSSVAS